MIGAVLGIEADYATLYAQLLAVKDSLGGLGFEDVKRLVDKAWEPIEGQMQEAGVTHEDVVTALGRHVGELATLGKTLAIVLAERALAVRIEAVAVAGQRAAADAQQQVSKGAAGGHTPPHAL